jgi:hypothetical protein
MVAASSDSFGHGRGVFGLFDQPRGDEGGVDQRLGDGHAARLFEQQDEVDLVHAETARAIVNHQAGHAHTGERGPKLRRPAGFGVPQAADALGVTLLGEHFAHTLLKKPLFFRKVKVHL